MRKPKLTLLRRMNVQLAVYFLIASFAMITVLALVFYLSASSIVLNDGTRQTNESVVQAGQYIGGYLDKVKALSDIIAMDPDTISALASQEQSAQKALLSMIDVIKLSDERILTIAVISKNGFALSSGEDMAMALSEDMMAQPWYIQAMESRQMPALSSTRHDTFSMDKQNWVVTVSREIVDDSGQHLGVVMIDIAYYFIEDYITALNLGNDGYAFIVTAGGDVIYHPDQTYFTDQYKKNSLIEICELGSGYRSDMGLITFKTPIAHSDWILVGLSSLENVDFLRKQLIESVFMISGILLVLSVIGGILLSKRMTVPMTQLEEAMRNLDETMPHLLLPKGGSEELQSLAIQYNAMIDRIKSLMADMTKHEKQTRLLELKALQSQINPHFLYNTLDTIVWLAEFGESEKVVAVTKSLGQLLRLSLNIDQTTIALEDELQHVAHYLDIQKQRYGDGLTYSIDGDQALLAIQVPKLIIQPMVENAIYHGIRQGSGQGHISITYQAANQILEITVKDDGVGFDPDAIPIHSKLKLGGIGIKNVDQRIKLHYGDGYGVAITSVIGEGTTAIYTLPL